jgi:thiol-disulfide isomerase/thioredoxin
MEKKKLVIFVILISTVVGSILFLESTKTKISSNSINNEELSVLPNLEPDTKKFPLEILDKSKLTQISSDRNMPDMPETEEMPREFTQLDLERIAEKEKIYSRAIELVNPDAYLNVDNFDNGIIKLKDFVGKKVILVDFWTYSCINCQRTLPYLTAWYEKYKDDGFVIVGVHTPEFEFEKDYSNVQRAMEKFGVTYPVVQDNNYYTWRAYKNRYWPRKYLIDIDGYIVYDHIGEGAYLETEKLIQNLLKERVDVLGLNVANVGDKELSDTSNVVVETPNFKKIGSPETYFGYERGINLDQFGNFEGRELGAEIEYEIPNGDYADVVEKNKFYLQGRWKNNLESMQLVGQDGKLVYKFFAKKVNLVAGTATNEPIPITIIQDGYEVKNIFVQEHDLYNLIDNQDYAEHTLEVYSNEGLEIFAFTFG